MCWKHGLQDVGGSGKENYPSTVKELDIQDVRLLSGMRKGEHISAFGAFQQLLPLFFFFFFVLICFVLFFCSCSPIKNLSALLETMS